MNQNLNKPAWPKWDQKCANSGDEYY